MVAINCKRPRRETCSPLPIADCRLSIVGTENRNSKMETRLHWVAAVFSRFQIFEFPESATPANFGQA
jgi:hypothetical protein